MTRKKRIINRAFQLKTTFGILGATVISFLAIIVMMGVVIGDGNNRIKTIVADINYSMEREKAIVGDLSVIAGRQGGDDFRKRMLEHDAAAASIDIRLSVLQDITARNRKLLAAATVLCIIISLALYFYLIRLTHRIAGPIYVLGRHVQDILNGREPNLREIRRDDEFQEFYHQFVEMARKIRK
ncbi:MAG: hypothetical protein MUD12_10755 [Spirochaetes bacterium]|jgi:predicted PurR-regulated permease PerM|nr:hypothetical protein [Spirochaetota bacterium]